MVDTIQTRWTGLMMNFYGDIVVNKCIQLKINGPGGGNLLNNLNSFGVSAAMATICWPCCCPLPPETQNAALIS